MSARRWEKPEFDLVYNPPWASNPTAEHMSYVSYSQEPCVHVHQDGSKEHL
jgi:hypothetical protein